MSDVSISKTQTETSSRVASLASNISLEDKAKLGAREVSDTQIDEAYHCIGPKAFAAAGFDQVRDMGDYRAARQWVAQALRSGMSPAEAERLILAEVTRMAERQSNAGDPIRWLGYCSKAINAAIAKGDVPEAPMSDAETLADRAWKRDMDTWRERAASGASNDPIPNRAEYLARAKGVA